MVVVCFVPKTEREFLVSAEGGTHARPHLGLAADGAAGAGLGAGIAALALEDVSRTADAAVADVGLVAGGGAVVLLVEREGRVLAGAVDVAGAANAAEVAARGGRGGVRGGGGLLRCAAGLGGRGAGDVAGAAAAGADVGGCGGGGLRDDVVGHDEGGFVVLCVVCSREIWVAMKDGSS